MVMIRNVVTVAMHGPEQVLEKPMGVTVVCDHLKMIDDGLDDLRRVMRRWKEGREEEQQAQQCREPTPSTCLHRS